MATLVYSHVLSERRKLDLVLGFGMSNLGFGVSTMSAITLHDVNDITAYMYSIHDLHADA